MNDENTHAPLDPSKVKAGDAVTVASTTTSGAAYEIVGKVWEPNHSPGHLWVGPIALDALGVTLTAHTPAPEPEPEWKPGHPVSAVVDNERRKGFITQRHFVHFVGDHRAEPIGYNVTPEFSDVRPLVVIDPAAVDVANLAALYEEKFVETNSSRAALRTVLAHLGIEPS